MKSIREGIFDSFEAYIERTIATCKRQYMHIDHSPLQSQHNLQIARYDGVLFVASHRRYNPIGYVVRGQGRDVTELKTFFRDILHKITSSYKKINKNINLQKKNIRKI